MDDNGNETRPKLTIIEGGSKSQEKFPPTDRPKKADELRRHARILLSTRPAYEAFYGAREEVTRNPSAFRFPKPGIFNGVPGELRTETTPLEIVYEATFAHPQTARNLKTGVEKITLRIPIPGMRKPQPLDLAMLEYELTNKDMVPIHLEDGLDAYREIWEAFSERFSPHRRPKRNNKF